MISSIKQGSVWLFIFILIPIISLGQNYQGYDFRTLSLTVNGGASLGDTNRNEYFLSSNFSTNVKNTPTFGLGMQYALSPIWSLELGYQHTQIKGLDRPFETNLNQISFRNIINLNQLLMINLITERFNPFITAGLGYDFYNYRSPDDDIFNHNSSYNLGGGLAYKLTNTVDLFTHYEYHIGSNELDNETEGWGSDLVNSLTAGIRLNFGKAKAIHPSWKPSSPNLSKSDYDLLMAQTDRIKQLSDKVTQLEERSDQNDQRQDSLIQGNRSSIDSLKTRMDLLEQQLNDLELTLSDLRGSINPVTVNDHSGIAELLPAGHYVQVFAAYTLSPAQHVRNHAVNQLQNSLQEAAGKIFIIKRKQYYEVLIGVLSDFSDATEIKEIMRDFHDDAYIISFPRPINLKMDFKGLKVVDEK